MVKMRKTKNASQYLNFHLSVRTPLVKRSYTLIYCLLFFLHCMQNHMQQLLIIQVSETLRALYPKQSQWGGCTSSAAS